MVIKGTLRKIDKKLTRAGSTTYSTGGYDYKLYKIYNSKEQAGRVRDRLNRQKKPMIYAIVRESWDVTKLPNKNRYHLWYRRMC